MECSICLEKYNSDTKRPRMLQCGHTFCESCLTKIYKQNLDNRVKGITCPFDKKIYENLSVKDVSINRAIIELLDRGLSGSSIIINDNLKSPEVSESKKNDNLSGVKEAHDQLQMFIREYNKSLTEISKFNKDFLSSIQQCKIKITNFFADLTKRFDDQRDFLIQKLTYSTKEQVNFLSATIAKIEKNISLSSSGLEKVSILLNKNKPISLPEEVNFVAGLNINSLNDRELISDINKIYNSFSDSQSKMIFYPKVIFGNQECYAKSLDSLINFISFSNGIYPGNKREDKGKENVNNNIVNSFCLMNNNLDKNKMVLTDMINNKKDFKGDNSNSNSNVPLSLRKNILRGKDDIIINSNFNLIQHDEDSISDFKLESEELLKKIGGLHFNNNIIGNNCINQNLSIQNNFLSNNIVINAPHKKVYIPPIRKISKFLWFKPGAKDIYSYDLLKHPNTKWNLMPNKINFYLPEYFRVAQISDTTAYIIGGLKGSQVISTVLFYNEDGIIESRSSMQKERKEHSIIIVSKYIYVCGGVDISDYPMTSCEKYDMENDYWTTIADMNYEKSYTSLINYSDKCIISIGGENGEEGVLDKIEIYDIGYNVWSVVDFDLACAVEVPACANRDGQILLFGGVDDTGCSNNIFEIDLERGVVRDKGQMNVCGYSIYQTVFLYDEFRGRFNYDDLFICLEGKDNDNPMIYNFHF